MQPQLSLPLLFLAGWGIRIIITYRRNMKAGFPNKPTLTQFSAVPVVTSDKGCYHQPLRAINELRR